MSCGCAQDWRLEVIDLQTGARIRYLPFLSFDFEELLNQVGSASVVVPLHRVTARDVLPHLRAVVFTRVAGPGASPSAPVAEYIGLVENATADAAAGTVTLGLQSIEYYLNYRIFTDGYGDDAASQTELGAGMVEYAHTLGGIDMMRGTSDTSAYLTDIGYTADSDSVILEAVSQLTQIENGPDYIREYSYTGGVWSVILRFVDVAGTTGGVLDSRRGITSYSMVIDGTNHANWIRGRGEVASFTVDDTATSIYPRFDLGVKVADVGLYLQLTGLVNGYRRNLSNPLITPDLTVARLDLATAYQLGDTPTLHLDRGMLRYDGPARVVGKSWRQAAEEPTTCTFSFVPADPLSVVDSLLDPTPRGVDCCD